MTHVYLYVDGALRWEGELPAVPRIGEVVEVDTPEVRLSAIVRSITWIVHAGGCVMVDIGAYPLNVA